MLNTACIQKALMKVPMRSTRIQLWFDSENMPDTLITDPWPDDQKTVYIVALSGVLFVGEKYGIQLSFAV